MNLQQLEYLVAVADTGQFVEAANRCHVTQATLSAMLKKLEEELGMRLIDRSKLPVKPTPHGVALIQQAREILIQSKHFKMLAEELKGQTAGHYRIQIIPTLSSALLPLLLPVLIKPEVDWSLDLKEVFTADLIRHIKLGEADFGILAGPLIEPGLVEWPLFDEAFYLMASAELHSSLSLPLDPLFLPDAAFWLLEEGHCLRHQMLTLCRDAQRQTGFTYQAGSTETLIRLVKNQGGMTLIPALNLQYLKDDECALIVAFRQPVPVRRISLVCREDYPRKHFLKTFIKTAQSVVSGLEGVWINTQESDRKLIPAI